MIRDELGDTVRAELRSRYDEELREDLRKFAAERATWTPLTDEERARLAHESDHAWAGLSEAERARFISAYDQWRGLRGAIDHERVTSVATIENWTSAPLSRLGAHIRRHWEPDPWVAPT